jgi:hypothetical protein
MDAGAKIVRSCELVESIWMQVADLSSSLGTLTESALKKGDFQGLQNAGSSTEQFQYTDSGWTTSAYGISFPVMEKKRRKLVPTAWINYQISVFGSGIPRLKGVSQESIGPVIHVSFWHLETDFDDPGVFVEFPSAWDEEWEIRDERLLYWESEKDGQLPQWTFSIRLLDLTSEDALRTCIIKPVRALLAGEQAAAALPSTLPGLIFYAGQTKGTLMPTRYNQR